MATYFEILGLGSDATLLEVRRAFRDRAAALHPDGGERTRAELDELNRVTEAYTAIKTGAKLEEYRAKILRTVPDRPASSGPDCPKRESGGNARARWEEMADQILRKSPTVRASPVAARYYREFNLIRFDLGSARSASRIVVEMPVYRRCLHATPLERRICGECSGREIIPTRKTITTVLWPTEEERAGGDIRRKLRVFPGQETLVQFVFDPHGRVSPWLDEPAFTPVSEEGLGASVKKRAAKQGKKASAKTSGTKGPAGRARGTSGRRGQTGNSTGATGPAAGSGPRRKEVLVMGIGAAGVVLAAMAGIAVYGVTLL